MFEEGSAGAGGFFTSLFVNSEFGKNSILRAEKIRKFKNQRIENLIKLQNFWK